MLFKCAPIVRVHRQDFDQIVEVLGSQDRIELMHHLRMARYDRANGGIDVLVIQKPYFFATLDVYRAAPYEKFTWSLNASRASWQ